MRQSWHRRYRVWIMGHAPRVQSWRGKQSARTDISRCSGAQFISETANWDGTIRNTERNGQHSEITERERELLIRPIADRAGETLPNANGRRAHTKSKRVTEREGSADSSRDGSLRSISDAYGGRRKSGRTRAGIGIVPLVDGNGETGADGFTDYWATEPDVGRVVDGVPFRLDRLRGLGNAIVPQVAYQLIKRMIEAEESA